MKLDEWMNLKVNVTAALAGIAMLVAATHLSSLLPHQYYFGFSRFLFYNQDMPHAADAVQANILSLMIKLLVPVLAGVIIGYFWREDGVLAASVAGFAGAVLMSWPALVDWDVVAPDYVQDYRNIFLLLYLAYTGAFLFFCRSGAMLGVKIREKLPFTIATGGPINITWSAIVKEGLKGIAAFAIEHVLQVFFANAS